MKFYVLNGWTNFWNKVSEFFITWWNNFIETWFSGDSPYFYRVLMAILFLVISLILLKIIVKISKKALKISKKDIYTKNKAVKKFALNFIKAVLYILIVFVFLTILGVNLSGFASIFSSAILAIGLSLQDVVGNFASGIIILSNKPFVSGDYVSIDNGNAEGTILEVGFLTTTIQTTNLQIYHVPNKLITSGIIENFSTNSTRRIVISLMVNYETDAEKTKELLMSLIKNDTKILQDPAPSTCVDSLNEYGYTINLKCYVKTEEYWDILYSFNEKIINLRQKENIKMPIKSITFLNENNKEIDLINKLSGK